MDTYHIPKWIQHKNNSKLKSEIQKENSSKRNLTFKLKDNFWYKKLTPRIQEEVTLYKRATIINGVLQRLEKIA